MAITIPPSGTPITKASIQDMHAAVANKVNAVPNSAISPFALGPQHLPGIVMGHNAIGDVGSVVVNTTPVPNIENVVSIGGFWQELANFQCTGAVLPPCVLLMYVTLHQSEWAAAPAAGNECWVTMYYRIGGVNSYPLWNLRGIASQTDDKNNEHVTIFDMLDMSGAGAPFTLNRIGVRAALYGGGGASPPPNATIANGSIGWLAFRKQ